MESFIASATVKFRRVNFSQGKRWILHVLNCDNWMAYQIQICYFNEYPVEEKTIHPSFEHILNVLKCHSTLLSFTHVTGPLIEVFWTLGFRNFLLRLVHYTLEHSPRHLQ